MPAGPSPLQSPPVAGIPCRKVGPQMGWPHQWPQGTYRVGKEELERHRGLSYGELLCLRVATGVHKGEAPRKPEVQGKGIREVAPKRSSGWGFQGA